MRWRAVSALCVVLWAGGPACSGSGDGDVTGSGAATASGGARPSSGGSGWGGTGGGSGSGGSDSGGRGAAGGNSGAGVGGDGASGSGGALGGAPGGVGGDASGSGGAASSAPASCAEPSWDAGDFAEVYDVGPEFEWATPSDVPWESIGPGTLVRIHRRATPYADKWVIAVVATAEAPVVVMGVPKDGLLPEITGVDATTRAGLNYWSETRGVIKIGGSSTPAVEKAEHIFVECLDISGAREESTFSDDGGASQNYDDNASAVFLENGAHITLRNNVFHDSGNGLFVANQSSDVLVSGNEIFDNGNVDSIYEHNSYTEARGITFEFNRYGELCAGCPGNNLKDRSSGLIIRYNFIEGGNRTLDLVDSSEEQIQGAPDYDDTFVYGNVLVEKDGGNRQIVHYGGDGDEANYRKGTLHFFHNTVVSERASPATLVRLSSAQATLDARNNLFFASPGSSFAVLEDAGTALLRGNWLPSGWLEGSPSLSGTVMASDNVEGSDPDFVNGASYDFSLEASSQARGAVVELAEAVTSHPVLFEPTAPGGRPRASSETAGAFE